MSRRILGRLPLNFETLAIEEHCCLQGLVLKVMLCGMLFAPLKFAVIYLTASDSTADYTTDFLSTMMRLSYKVSDRNCRISPQTIHRSRV